MRHDDPRLRHQLLQPGAGAFHGLHPVMDEVHLAAAAELAENGLPNELVARADDLGADGQPARRRRIDDRQVAHAGHGHLQRPRDRRRGQGQHVHLRAQLLEALLVLDAEPLLFVDDDQAEIAELHVLLEQAMGADDDVDRSPPPSPSESPWLPSAVGTATAAPPASEMGAKRSAKLS